MALDEIKASEQVKIQELVNKSNLERDGMIQVLQQELKSLHKDLHDIKEFELKRLRDPNYIRKKQRQEVEDEIKRTGKNLLTVLAEKLSIDAMISPKMMESIKKLP